MNGLYPITTKSKTQEPSTIFDLLLTVLVMSFNCNCRNMWLHNIQEGVGHAIFTTESRRFRNSGPSGAGRGQQAGLRSPTALHIPYSS